MYISDVASAHRAWASWKSICNKIGFSMEGDLFNQIVTSTIKICEQDMTITLTDFAVILEYGEYQRVSEFEFDSNEAIQLAAVMTRLLSKKIQSKLTKTLVIEMMDLR